MKALCVHAHFDDFEFMCAGTFELWRRKLGPDFRGRIPVCTDGAAGHHFRTREETGPDGDSQPDFNGPWMGSIEYQLIEGATGDFIVIRGHVRDGTPIPAPTLTSIVRFLRNGQTNWDPQGEPMVFDENNRQRLWVSYKDPDWKSVLGYRGANDVEKPVGEWNKAEIICKGDTVTFILDGQSVNRSGL